MTIKQNKAKTPIYIGFSTVGTIKPPYNLNDIDLVKQDLLNTFKTRKGERVMMPEFGSDIPAYLFDPFDDVTVDMIRDDATAVIDTDPRVRLEQLDVIELEHGIRLEIVLYYEPTSTAEPLVIDFLQQDEDQL